jgi:uncharacterized protein YndB with AHSA1/START domain
VSRSRRSAHGQDGVHGFEGRYREVTPQERLVQTFEWDGMPGVTRRRLRPSSPERDVR